MRSMTGYGRIEKIIGDYNYSVEIKTLNGKYSNVKISLASIFSSLEIDIQNLIKSKLNRGNISVYIDIRFMNPEDFVDVDLGLAKSYSTALDKIASELHLSDEVSLDVLTKFREIIKIKIKEEKQEEIWEGLKNVLEETIEKVIEFQKHEGEDLKSILLSNVDELKEMVKKIENLSNDMKEEFRKRIKENLDEILDSEKINEDRLELEVALLAEKADISEEIDRLKSHLSRFTKIINDENESKGQKLDFLCQELHREFNTIASKSKITDITNLSVDGRVVVNKLREQVQNVH
ncbi:YicC/YloC family endoribonuclease [Geotoga petraea]|uniref:TIGR00255 family protein n=1 Tax=Geotoga petraea TaxID=28234 RepID=A0A1G6NJ81_9BACT|nr:YicC/YloC family endoribonuclease [Geotoga petraea]TGG87843.1 YicC family protein [Geotoga petraea]SDC68050.1 TIGR00255 family protein [Geotoga petraea]